MGEPAVNARYMKSIASALLALGERGLRVRAADPALFDEIEAASSMRWLPVETNVRLVVAVHGALGSEGMRQFFARALEEQQTSTLWRSFSEGAIRLLGLDPGALVRWLPHAMRLLFRDCGRWTADVEGAGQAVIRGEDLPQLLAAHPLWMESLVGGFDALFRVCRRDGATRIAEHDPGARRATYRLVWKPEG